MRLLRKWSILADRLNDPELADRERRTLAGDADGMLLEDAIKFFPAAVRELPRLAG